MTDSKMQERRVTFQDAHPDKGDDVVLCKLCGETLHAPEDDVFWEETANHACIAPVADAELEALATELDEAWNRGTDFEKDYLENVRTDLFARASTALRAHTAQTVGVWPDFIAPPKYENPCEGWEDPRLPDFRVIWETARAHGYSVGLHGSMKRDCDLIAAPWVDNPASPEELVEALCEALNATQAGEAEAKPVGRIAVTLQIDGYVKPIDLSIMPAQPVGVRVRELEEEVALWKMKHAGLVAFIEGRESNPPSTGRAKSALLPEGGA